MRGNEFQDKALRTAGSNDSERLMLNAALGLAGESGEACDHIKKYMFQGHNLDADHLAEELGDIMWYVAIMGQAIGYSLDTIMRMNVQKLEIRYPDGFDSEKSINREEKIPRGLNVMSDVQKVHKKFKMPELSKDYRYICVDFDGTLCEECWPQIGEPRWHVFDWLSFQRQNYNSKIILHTCRADERLIFAIEWCRGHGLVFDAINSNPFSEFAHLGEGNKPYADLYLDDKAYRC